MKNGARKLGIYVHSPYCLKKCKYCDFVSYAENPKMEYYEEICREIEKRGAECSKDYVVDSIFFGGGTPSLATKEMLSKVLDAIKTNFEVEEGAEISIEANPETLSREKLDEILALGFNRISVGVQSLDDEVLRTIGRVHSADKAREALGILASYNGGRKGDLPLDAGAGEEGGQCFEEGINFNVDLMLGLPGQTVESFMAGLKEVLTYKPKHISFYSLQLEEGTQLYEEYRNGKVELPSWEDNRRMYHGCLEELKQLGYHHYEVSNAALPGYECRHNLKYWNMEPYLGFGVSAHSFLDNDRTYYYVNQENTGAESAEKATTRGNREAGGNREARGTREAGGAGAMQSLQRLVSPQSEADLKGDFIFTQLRLIDGLDLDKYKEMFAADFLTEHKQVLENLFANDMLKLEGNKLMFTEKGLDNTNPVMEKLLNEH